MKHLSVIPNFLILVLTLAACGGSQFSAGGRDLPTPDDPGLYVLSSDERLNRIDGSVEWERETWPSRSNFPPDVEFIVFDPQIALEPRAPEEIVRLRRVAWLRSELEPTGQAKPAVGSEWVVPDLAEYVEPMIATPHPENPGIVHFRSFERLNPGLYELAVSTGAQSRSARVGILWDSLNQREYSAANCVDRIIGTDAGYRSCTERGIGSAQLVSDSAPFSQVQPSLGGLAITLANPVRENNGLTIRGTVTNNSAIVQPVPALRATLIDQAGEPADSWTFVTSQSSIEPGAQIGFTTWRPAMQGATRLDVDFVDADRRAG